MAGLGINSGQRGTVHLVRLDHPVTAEWRAALMARLADVSDIVALVVVLRGSGAIPLEADRAAPSLRALCAAVEAAPIPVVAALAGNTAGPEAELALAATARVAAASSRLAFCDIALGQVSEAGATQRLPRLIGPDQALRLLTKGQSVSAAEAQALGLVDLLAEGDPSDAALALAADIAAGRRLPRRAHDPKAWIAAVANARRATAREAAGSRSAVARIVDCVEAALILPPESGFALEEVAREDLEDTDEVHALRAAALAERRAAALPPALARQSPPQVRTLGLRGEDPALATLAAAGLVCGFAVIWATPDETAQGRARAAVEARLNPGQRAALRLRLQLHSSPAVLKAAGLVIHAVPPAADERLFLAGAAQLVLGGAPGMPGLRVAPSGRICELTLAAEAAPAEAAPAAVTQEVAAQELAAQEVATGVATLRRMGMRAVLVGGGPGLGHMVMQAGTEALMRMAALGVPRRMITAALEDFGARQTEPDWPDPPSRLCAMTQAEIGHRWLAALANAGLKALDAGIARRPSDVDCLLVAGHGFPRRLGGPMHQADRRGLMVLRSDLRRWAEEDGFWTPAPVLDRLIGAGLRLSALDG